MISCVHHKFSLHRQLLLYEYFRRYYTIFMSFLFHSFQMWKFVRNHAQVKPQWSHVLFVCSYVIVILPLFYLFSMSFILLTVNASNSLASCTPSTLHFGQSLGLNRIWRHINQKINIYSCLFFFFVLFFYLFMCEFHSDLMFHFSLHQMNFYGMHFQL